MELEIISYNDLNNPATVNKIKAALFTHGIVGVKDVPNFKATTEAYVKAAREFSALNDEIKEQYAPLRDAGDTEGYELGAEQFQDKNGNWHVDTKKASFYALVPDQAKNKWPREVDLKTHYLALANLIFSTGKSVLSSIGLNETIGIHHDDLTGYGRMLHYHQENDATNDMPWCGAHLDHSVFTGLAPAYYFREGHGVDEPAESGLYVRPANCDDFIKVNSSDKSVLLFQTGEFGQLATNDNIRATKHVVKKAKENIERFTLAVFFNAKEDVTIQSTSELAQDSRYADNQDADGKISFKKWDEASHARYRANT